MRHNNTKFNPYQQPKPIRYVVNCPQEKRNTPETDEDFDLYGNTVSYSTELDSVHGMPTAYSQAVHTASRFNGEIIAVYGDEKWVSVKTYR